MELGTVRTFRFALATLLLFSTSRAFAAPRKPTPTPTRAATPTPSPGSTPPRTSTPTRTPTRTPTPRPVATPTPPPVGSVSITITEPGPGATIAADRFTVRGTFQGPVNTGVTVNGRLAYIGGGRFIANDVPLDVGTNTVTTVASAPDGRSATASVTFTATGGEPSPSLTADVTRGFAPLTVTFSYTFFTGVGFRRLDIDFDGDGHSDYRSTSPSGTVQNTYTNPGLYLASLTVTDSAGQFHRADVGIEIDDGDALDGVFQSVWNPMNAALQRGDVNGALLYLNSSAQERYGRIFSDLISDMPAIVSSYSAPQRVSVQGEFLEYAINRMIDGENQIFFVYVLRDADGVWRMDSM